MQQEAVVDETETVAVLFHHISEQFVDARQILNSANLNHISGLFSIT
jgi:hypothetical protein